MNKDKIMGGVVSSANEGRLSDSSTSVSNTDQPKSTNMESHGGKYDVASTEKATINPESHGNSGSNSKNA